MKVQLRILPRQVMSWPEFVGGTPRGSIALDGMVSHGPAWEPETLHSNFDHHGFVVREATMSTAMQVYFAIKGGLMERLASEVDTAHVYMNDPDQDTSLASWLLVNHRLFEGVQSHPTISRLLALTDRLDITGGAFPMALGDEVAEMQSWVFDPYTTLRTSGALSTANEAVMRNCIEAVHEHLGRALRGMAGRKKLSTDYSILHNSPYGFQIVDERGGNEARYYLFSKGMNAFVSRVATAQDGTFVYSIGRRSRYIDFPVDDLYHPLNLAENIVDNEGLVKVWGGSDIVGGCGRAHRSRLDWPQVRDVIEGFLAGGKRRG